MTRIIDQTTAKKFIEVERALFIPSAQKIDIKLLGIPNISMKTCLAVLLTQYKYNRIYKPLTI